MNTKIKSIADYMTLSLRQDNKITPVIPDIKKIFNRKIVKGILKNVVPVIHPYKDKFHRKVVYRVKNNIVQAIFQYNVDDKKWYIID